MADPALLLTRSQLERMTMKDLVPIYLDLTKQSKETGQSWPGRKADLVSEIERLIAAGRESQWRGHGAPRQVPQPVKAGRPFADEANEWLRSFPPLEPL
ncbi:hypothetical protein [Rhodobacter capsulatus]|uniref:hypothetical protein n=1 Tax=Rhodobacter capsulatus TaxID=1061 RepID=UPI0003D3720C|nr:hypothetical protein [Rhodobacter capsulatus]ETD89923.1 hypothetical protein U713_07265 [Rhodobacter capsulatus YW2]